MTRSGIKQGLAISAVSALSVVGIPAAAHAAGPSPDAYQMNLSASSTSVVTGQATKYTLTVKNQNGGVATGDVTVNVSEAAANPLNGETNPLAITAASADAPEAAPGDTGSATAWDDTVTVTLDAKGQATFDVASAKAGTVTVAASANGAAASSTLTVAAAASGQNAVTSLTASTTSIDNYLADVSAQTVKVTPLANGLAMQSGVVVNYVLTGPAGVAPITGTATTVAPDQYTAPVASISLGGINQAGNWTLKTWVNKTTGTTTPDADAGEPTASVSINAVANPTVYSDSSGAYSNLNGWSTTALVDQVSGTTLPADGQATTVSLSARLLDNTTDKPVAGVSVGVDVIVDTPAVGTPDAVRYTAVSDSNGIVTVNVPVSAAEAVDGTVINAELVVSKSKDAGVGSDVEISAGDVLTFAKRTPGVSVVDTNSKIQAASGSKVTVPVKVADQFGKGTAGVAVTGTVAGRDAGATVTGGTTDGSGNASVSYTDTGVSGTSSVTVNTAGLAGANSDVTTVSYVSSLAPALVKPLQQQYNDGTVVGSFHGTTINAGDPTPNVVVSASRTVPGQVFTGQVVNAVGDPLVNAAVTVSVDNGLVTDAADTKNIGSSITVHTDDTGAFTVAAGSFKAGSQTITVTAGTAAPVKSYVVKYVADAPYSVTVSPSISIIQGESAKVVAKVTDQFGNPVQNVNLVFSQTGTGAFAGGASTAFAFTATDGTASVTLDSLGKVGSGTVTVTPAFGPITTPKADAMVAAYTAPIDVKYTVSAKPAPPVVVPPAQPKPAAITKLRGHSVGKKDVLVISAANANGKKVVVKVHGHKVGSAIVKGGKAYIKVKDHNGKKATKYSVRLGSIIKAFKVK